MKTFKTPVEERIAKRMDKRLRKLGMKLVKKGEGYAILIYSEPVKAWVEAEGMFPVPYSLTIEEVVRLSHDYVAEAEIESLTIPDNVLQMA
ncbi:MAG: hypothetical protein RI553_08630 [Salibaculum sp.]|uniref:hypothetical protein n=1 Tax=Salibaculum sp. TaxID=2855480 RepID=UPI0028703DF6|nr:hypothetical protein [Salibaculum sp.]MDR9428159.1 hypothetical protein [Salibaculum sp.]